jgi:hypothetical protein
MVFELAQAIVSPAMECIDEDLEPLPHGLITQKIALVNGFLI